MIYAGRLIDRDNLPMLDPFKEGLVATGKAQQTITNQQIEKGLAAQFPSDSGKELVLNQCSGCHSLKVVLEQQKSKAEWETTVAGMLDAGNQEMDEIVSYLVKHLGR
ncbi:hypothetical protein MYX82_12585 [Acidobacteria bacterium AH-259-D05]|nr:hypothetical protein [Acidobacteria bacterium AH-259-D05]